ncbi:unnamed protein product [Urochloa humidicola]
MEPQPGSPPSPGTSSSSSPNSAEVAAPPDEMPAPDETVEVEQEPARKYTSSSSSSSSSESSAESLRDVDVVDLGDTLMPAPEDKQAAAAALPEPSASDGKLDGKAGPVEEQPAPPLVETAAGTKPDDDHTAAGPAAHCAEVKPEDEQAKPEDWATTWPEEAPPPAVDYSFSSDGSAGAGAAPAAPTEAAQVQTMLPAPESGGTGSGEFDPERIPASVFQPRTSMSQAEWSMTSNESLFSIQGADVVGGPPYAGSRSHFDFFYDEAMAAAAVESEASAKLPSVAEGTEPAAESSSSSSREFKVPGSAGSQSSDNANKAAAVYRRNDSGSGGSSSNFSFAFPILAPTSPKKKEHASSALYQPLEKGWEPQRPVATQMEPPESAFVEMTTEAERRGSTEGCCCCGCCWFDCSWATCCGWWRFCSCACPCCCCSCPSFCRCSWCLCS